MFPHEQVVSCVQQAQAESRTRYCWVINHLCDYTNFDWLWEPTPWEAEQAHVWPSQHQQNSGTWLLPKKEYQDINRNHAIVPRKQSVPKIHIKHNPNSADFGDVNVYYVSDYLGTIRRALKKMSAEYCWVTSDVCDYTAFDFTWHPSEWQQTLLHVFASNEQKFGDTFYIHVPSFLQQTQGLKILEWYDGLHFVPEISVPRHLLPVVNYDSDSVVDAVWQHDFADPVVLFQNTSTEIDDLPTISLWQESMKTVTPLSLGSSYIIVPRECKNYLKTQLYDYPYVNKSVIKYQDQPLDIVFISNGEPNAQENWDHLNKVIKDDKKLPHQIHHCKNVAGRVAAYHAAAKISQTPWFFAVFAKLEVFQSFDWNWQPDRMQQAKHYIFHAVNPVNGLIYGHQAMIAYNKTLVLNNPGQGLDFTLDNDHEVVPLISGVARYNISPWVCWRTAFREALKLQHNLPDIDSQYRLDCWLSTGWGTHGKWSMIGAKDAVEYYHEVNGDADACKLSYDWQWLSSYAFMKHNLIHDQ